ncbi:hypothetical protein Vafri_15727 [Volvox africanus]|nr:hypothetical protein Vafri_15727 [Volvox africanus]
MSTQFGSTQSDAVSWILQYPDGSIGMAHTVPPHRRRGLMRRCVRKMTQLVLIGGRQGNGGSDGGCGSASNEVFARSGSSWRTTQPRSRCSRRWASSAMKSASTGSEWRKTNLLRAICRWKGRRRRRWSCLRSVADFTRRGSEEVSVGGFRDLCPAALSNEQAAAHPGVGEGWCRLLVDSQTDRRGRGRAGTFLSHTYPHTSAAIRDKGRRR